MMINLELYRVFYIVAKSGSLTKASHELFLSQPAVSQSIKQLEKQLGGRLFFRTARGMELTSEGKEMFEYISRAYELIQVAENRFSQMKELTFGDVRIGASDNVSKYFLIKKIRIFRDKYPDINIRVLNTFTDGSLALLKQGQLDMAIINNNENIDFEGIDIAPCLEVGECFVVNESLYKQLTHPLTAEELSEKPLIMLGRKSGTRRLIDNAFYNNGVQVKPQLELSSIELIVEFSKIGMGFGCVTKEFINDELENHSLYEVPLAFELPKRRISLATLKGIPLSFASNKFAEILQEK